jgi:hypothetical protein
MGQSVAQSHHQRGAIRADARHVTAHVHPIIIGTEAVCNLDLHITPRRGECELPGLIDPQRLGRRGKGPVVERERVVAHDQRIGVPRIRGRDQAGGSPVLGRRQRGIAQDGGLEHVGASVANSYR